MKQSISDSFIEANEADDILQYLALGILKSRTMELKTQPSLNVLELYNWMPDDEHLFASQEENTTLEQPPLIAVVEKNAGNGHFYFEAFQILRDCYDAGEYIVKYIPEQKLTITEPYDYARLRRHIHRWTAEGKEAEGIKALPNEADRKRFPLPPQPEEVLVDLSGIMRPLTRQKFERDSDYLSDHMDPHDFAHNERGSVSDDTLLAIGVSTMKRKIETVHRFWRVCQSHQPQVKHPLSPIIRAWLDNWMCQQDAKHITLEFDKHRTVGILQRESMGSVRDVVDTMSEGRSASSELIAPPAPKEKQLTFLKSDAVDSKLPAILPFELYQMGAATAKRAAVAMPVRLAFEVLLQMEPGAHTERLHWKLGDLIECLNPDGKFHWTNQVGYVLKGLSALYCLRFPYQPEGEGEVDWIPFLPRAVPNQNSSRESRIIVEVSLPPDISAGGMMVEKNIVRLLGKKSSARFNAYLTACWIFDRYGTVKGKIIDPTMPVEKRNKQGVLVDKDDVPIFDSHGKPVKNVKSKEAAQRLEREVNPHRSRYPILANEDLMRACYPRGVPLKQRREYLRRAKQAWLELESDDFIRIEQSDSGWRIMPSDQHVRLYRTVKSPHVP